MAIAIILIIVGYIFDGILFKTIGYAMLFLINFPILANNDSLEYKTGETLNGGITTYDYSNYSNYWLFSILALLGVFGIILLSVEEYQNGFKHFKIGDKNED